MTMAPKFLYIFINNYFNSQFEANTFLLHNNLLKVVFDNMNVRMHIFSLKTLYAYVLFHKMSVIFMLAKKSHLHLMPAFQNTFITKDLKAVNFATVGNVKAKMKQAL